MFCISLRKPMKGLLYNRFIKTCPQISLRLWNFNSNQRVKVIKFCFWKQLEDNSLFWVRPLAFCFWTSNFGVKTRVDEELFRLTSSATSSDTYDAQLSHSDALTFSNTVELSKTLPTWKIRPLNVTNSFHHHKISLKQLKKRNESLPLNSFFFVTKESRKLEKIRGDNIFVIVNEA